MPSLTLYFQKYLLSAFKCFIGNANVGREICGLRDFGILRLNREDGKAQGNLCAISFSLALCG